MRTKFFAAAVLASSVLAAPAFAQSDVDTGFTGPRVEALVGWDRLQGDKRERNSNGVTYGVAAGYDHQIGTAVIGLEGEVTGSTNRNRERNVLVQGDQARASLGRDLYVGGRVGFIATPNALVYAKLGYTNSQVRNRYENKNVVTRDHVNVGGWRAGAGVEVKLTGRTYAKAEYRFSKYDSDKLGVRDQKRHQILAGVGARF